MGEDGSSSGRGRWVLLALVAAAACAGLLLLMDGSGPEARPGGVGPGPEVADTAPMADEADLPAARPSAPDPAAHPGASDAAARRSGPGVAGSPVEGGVIAADGGAPRARAASPAAPLAGVCGRVVDAGGRPVAGAEVRVGGTPSGPGAVQRITVRRGPDGATRVERPGEHQAPAAVTDEEGRFAVEGLPADLRITVRVAPPGPFLPTAVPGPDLRPGETVDVGDVVVHQAGRVSGVVVGPDGGPVAGAHVRVEGGFSFLTPPAEDEAEEGEGAEERTTTFRAVRVVAGGAPAGGPLALEGGPPPATRTDGAGRFTLEGVTPGTHTLVARKRGLRTARREGVEVAEGETTRDVRLELGAGLGLIVAVRDPDGQPVVGARVRVGGGPFAGAATREVATDGAGEARFDGLASAEVHLTVVAEGAVPASQRLVLADERERVEVVVRPGATLRGRVVRARDGTPVDGGSAFAEPAVHGGRLEVRMGAGGGRVDDGAFALTGVAPGQHRVRVRAPGLAEAERLVTVAEGQSEVDLGELRLGELGSLDVTVLDPEGAPVAGAEVSTVGAFGGVAVLVQATVDEGGGGEEADAAGDDGPGPRIAGPSSARTDGAGRARLTGLDPGEVTLRARKVGFGEGRAAAAVPDDGAAAAVTIRLTVAARVEGRLLDAAGAPAADASLTLVGEGQLGSTSARTDEAGRFAFGDLSPGRYRLVAERGGLDAASAASFAVAAGEVASRDLRLAPARALTGVVRRASGAPVAGARVVYGRLTTWAPGDPVVEGAEAETTTDAAGRYRLADLGAREGYGLAVTPPGGEPLSFRIDAAGAGERDLVLPDPRELAVAVTVWDGLAGRPAAGAEVELARADDGPAIRRARSAGADGAVELQAPPGRYLLRAALEGRARAQRVVELGGEPAAARLELGAEGALLVEVSAPGLDGAPFGLVQAVLTSADDPEDVRELTLRPGRPSRLGGLTPGAAYRLTLEARGFAPLEVTLTAGEPREPTPIALERR